MTNMEMPKDSGMWAGLGALAMQLMHLLWDRSDRAEKRIEQIAVRAAEDSKKFVLAGEQRIVNEQVRSDIASVKRTVDGIDLKLDAILLGGRLQIKKDE